MVRVKVEILDIPLARRIGKHLITDERTAKGLIEKGQARYVDGEPTKAPTNVPHKPEIKAVPPEEVAKEPLLEDEEGIETEIEEGTDKDANSPMYDPRQVIKGAARLIFR